MSNGGGGAGDSFRSTEERWSAFDQLTPELQRVVRDCGINIDPIEVVSRVRDLRGKGLSDPQIAQWLEAALKTLTHQKYLRAGHPQPA